ncbi:MAG: sulfatase [Deltaproteobacteria bacterium]|nr:sulfatase [Deltaproteobacteria bacterium]
MRTKSVQKLLLLVVAAGLLYLGYRAVLGRTASTASSRPNLIFISLDTLRADRLGVYGYERPTSPFLDSWASGAAVFEHAVSTAPWTLPSHVTMLTGLYPSSHGVNKAKQRGIGTVMEYLPEILHKQGYQTFAFTGGGYVSERYGFGRGFDAFVFNHGEDISEARGFPYTIKMAQEKLAAMDRTKPYFLFLHTYAVHCPYDPPAPYGTMFSTPGAEPVEYTKCNKYYNLQDGFTAAKALYLSDRYDGSIRYLDTQIEKLFTDLRKEGFLDNTYIVITSDHGEEFFEHGRIGHKKSLHKELLLVPLIISGPGIKAQRVNESVSNADLFPTILQLLGLPPSKQPDGHSLFALMHGQQEEFSRPPYQYSELHHAGKLRSLFDPEVEHFILDLKTNIPLLYDSKNDPREANNIANARPDRILEWRSILDRLSKSLYERPTGSVDPATKEQLEQLKTLGYL